MCYAAAYSEDVDNSGLLQVVVQQAIGDSDQQATQNATVCNHELAPMTLYDISNGKVNTSNRFLTAKCKQARIVNIIAVVLAMLALHLCLNDLDCGLSRSRTESEVILTNTYEFVRTCVITVDAVAT
jgi:hypothetical protein